MPGGGGGGGATVPVEEVAMVTSNRKEIHHLFAKMHKGADQSDLFGRARLAVTAVPRLARCHLGHQVPARSQKWAEAHCVHPAVPPPTLHLHRLRTNRHG